MAKKKKRTGGQVSTNLVYLDLSVILNNYKNPKFWGRKWIIYKSGDLEIYWIMTHIDVRNSKIYSEIRANPFTFRKGNYERIWCDSNYAYCNTIPLDNPEYNQQIFENNIFGSCINLIRIIEEYLIQGYAEYKRALDLECESEERLTEIATEIAEQYVTKGEYASRIIEAFVDDYVSKHKEDFTSDVLRQYDHKVLGNHYLMVCSWFGKEREFEEHRRKVGNNKKGHNWLKLFAKAKEIQTDEWLESMREEADKLIKDAL